MLLAADGAPAYSSKVESAGGNKDNGGDGKSDEQLEHARAKIFELERKQDEFRERTAAAHKQMAEYQQEIQMRGDLEKKLVALRWVRLASRAPPRTPDAGALPAVVGGGDCSSRKDSSIVGVLKIGHARATWQGRGRSRAQRCAHRQRVSPKPSKEPGRHQVRNRQAQGQARGCRQCCCVAVLQYGSIWCVVVPGVCCLDALRPACLCARAAQPASIRARQGSALRMSRIDRGLCGRSFWHACATSPKKSPSCA